ncbi:MAG TPA: histidine phosphatase family protein [Solirubrobacterales bacterium]|jgi:broad specificity phosphatase PhoE|nr:histidine phosphatase family protein [Solirubrobacterales bacterium]
MPQALLLRHAQSISNAHPEALTLPEEEGDRLTAAGVDQARAAAESLADYGIAQLLSSPMRRAQETAAFVGERLDLPVTVLPYLYELKEELEYGLLSPEEQVLRRGVTRMAAHPEDPDQMVNGAESFRMIVDRVRRLKAELESGPERQRSLVVTHGVFTRFFFLDCLLGDAFVPASASLLWSLRSRNCGLSAFERGERWHPTDADTPGWTCITWMARPWDPP